MRHRALFLLVSTLPHALSAQSSTPAKTPDGIILEFARYADQFGSRLLTAFDSIPAAKYDYRPTPIQQTIGFIAQHLETANYGLCERLGGPKRVKTAKDALPDTVKARWPKDTLIARLDASLRFCDEAIERLGSLDSPERASVLLGFQTDLAEHYSQIAVYMRLLGLVPPSALPPVRRVAIELPAASMAQYVGTYLLGTGVELSVTLRDGALFVQASGTPNAVRLWPEANDEFFVKEADAQISFTRGPNQTVTGLVLHQFRRHRPARKIRADPNRPD
jgi:uncharacterized damage-inducible protein DinB